MSRRPDRLLGNILLDNYLQSKRSRPVLKRNLDRILKVHKYVLENGSTEGIFDTYHDLRSKWHPPSWDILDDMIALEKLGGLFKLEVHGFKSLNPNLAFVKDRPLKKDRNLFFIRSEIRVTIHSDSSDLPHKSLPGQQATIAGKDSNYGVYAAVVTDPMAIAREELLIDGNENGIDNNKTYRLTLSVNLGSLNDAEDLYVHMGDNTGGRNISTRLSTSYGNIISRQAEKIILPLTASRERLGFGIEVSMDWVNTGDESILSASNRQQKRLNTPIPYPSPPMEIEPKYTVRFVYADEKVWCYGFRCPHCQKEHDFGKSLQDFKTHILLWHENFRYAFFEDGENEDGVVQIRFQSNHAHHNADRAESLDRDQFSNYVVAPARAFDAERFTLHGDMTWQREATRRVVPARPIFPQPARPSPFDTLSFGSEPLDGVKEIPVRLKRTFVVPKAPSGVTFFRSFSKRPLVEGEVIDESDDDIDTEWADERKEAEIEKNVLLSDAMKRFLKLYDKHMAKEGLQSQWGLGDALIRFVHKNANSVWQQDVFNDFKVKLDELLEDKIIKKSVHSWCIRMVESYKSSADNASHLTQRLAQLDVQPAQTSFSNNTTSQNPSQRRIDKGKGKARVSDVEMREAGMPPSRPSITRQEQEQQEDSEDIPYDLCLCGQDAQVTAHVLPVITCNGVDCIRRYFHLDCLKHNSDTPLSLQDAKKRTWTCNKCQALTDTAT